MGCRIIELHGPRTDRRRKRIMRKKISAVIALVLVLAITLCACGSGSNSVTPNNSGSNKIGRAHV